MSSLFTDLKHPSAVHHTQAHSSIKEEPISISASPSLSPSALLSYSYDRRDVLVDEVTAFSSARASAPRAPGDSAENGFPSASTSTETIDGARRGARVQGQAGERGCSDLHATFEKFDDMSRARVRIILLR